ncbi:DUF4917 family protein [Devosia alba]|uniref:DUF4917 family protein n=1 Tax=Devosia alba TaxID=3152360 RepID=UPI0032669AC5
MISFSEAIEQTADEDRALLIGNGFSSKYTSYSTLLSKSGLEEGSDLRSLFDALETVDFEAVVHSLEQAAIVEMAYGNAVHSNELVTDAQKVREALVNAVRTTHPAHRDELAAYYESGASFLSNFKKVFTLNYDLLLYWVNLESRHLSDGFGKGTDADNFKGPFYEDAWCDIYNLHGGLHLFQDDRGDVIKALNGGDGVIATITKTIVERKRLPVYVAEGSSNAKMLKINSVGYLRHCYDELLSNTASHLFVYGHSADDNDAHIYRAIFSSGVKKVYFGVYKPTEEKIRVFRGQLARHKELGGRSIDFTFYDAASADLWADA